uniref:Atlastin n=1 Tax=Magallana gigas TaxID=29159 RepID=K1R576_MAGGI
MEHDDVKDNVVMIVSIAGALRKGKSFLLGFFLKYLKAEMSDDWLNEDDTIEGFEWRNGTDAVTHGIQIWSKPFIVETESEGKVAILLMDTQGVFDCKSTKQDCANIFTLSGLISSVQYGCVFYLALLAEYGFC